MTVNAEWIIDTADDPEVFVHAEPDLRFPKYAYLDVVDEPDITVDLRIRVYFEKAYRRYMVDSIDVRRRPRWDSVIDGTSLRSLRIQEYLRRGLPEAIRVELTDGKLIPISLEPDQVAQIRLAGPSNDESLRWVARLYSIAWALHEPPAQKVQDELGLARPTTSVWLRRARDRGLLTDPTDPERTQVAMDDYRLIRKVLDE